MNRQVKRYRSWAEVGIYNEKDHTVIEPSPIKGMPDVIHTVPEKYRGKFRDGQELRFIRRVITGKRSLATSIEPNYDIIDS